jgi:CheY-like chemotaxis protein
VRDHVFALKDVYDRVLAEELLSMNEEASGAAIAAGEQPAASPGPATASPEPAASPAATAQNGPAAMPRILIVDDDPDSRALVERTLDSGGYDVTLAQDGASALVALGGKSFDLVIADLAMPMLDGFSLLQVMASQGIQVPVIFLTGSGLPEDEARGLSLGAVDYIRKPARRDVLLARVARALDTAALVASV